MTDDATVDELRATIEHSLTFRSLAAGDVVLRMISVHVADEVTAEVEASPETWRAIFATGAFHLDGEDDPRGFDDDRPVIIRLRLRLPVVALYDDADDLLSNLVGDPASPPRHTEAWMATEVSQSSSVPGEPTAVVEIGFRTQWAGPVI
jgi:hypothetical protein